MKKPPVSEWWGSIRIQRSKGSDAASALGNILLDSLCGLFYNTTHKGGLVMSKDPVCLNAPLVSMLTDIASPTLIAGVLSPHLPLVITAYSYLLWFHQ